MNTTPDYVYLWQHTIPAAEPRRGECRVVAPFSGDNAEPFALYNLGSGVPLETGSFQDMMHMGAEWTSCAVSSTRTLLTERRHLGPLGEVWTLLEHGFRAAFGREPTLRAVLYERADGSGYDVGVTLDGIGVAPAQADDGGEPGFLPCWRLWTTALARPKDGPEVAEVTRLPDLERGPASAARRVLLLCAERLIDNALADSCYALPGLGKPRC